MGNRGWKTSELKILNEHYPKGGAFAVSKFVDRSIMAIHHMAFRYGLSAPRPHVTRVINKSI